MLLRHFLALVLAALSLCANGAEGHYFKFAELLESSEIKDALDPDIKLYWGSQPRPGLAEVARPDLYANTAISISPFGGSRRHCVEAFGKALRAMIADARRRGYDAIIDIQAVYDDGPSGDGAGFYCKPGYKVTQVPLTSSFGMTEQALLRAVQAEQGAASLPARSPVEGAIFLPLEPILASDEARALLGPAIGTHWGIGAPAYRERYGPDVYAGEADMEERPAEDACKLAELQALESMVEDARSREFDSIIRIRSFLEEQFAPDAGAVECLLDGGSASVALQASLANIKP